jgi:uncharacterized protein YunC (DUF1805 family)
MKYERISVGHKVGEAFTIPLGLVNIVFITTDTGMVGCGAFDVKALDKFGYPAARANHHKEIVSKQSTTFLLAP